MKAVLGALILGIFVKCVIAIECYECADCSVPFDDGDDHVSKIECEQSSCIKLNITHTNKITIVSRGCGGNGVEKEQCEKKEVSGTYSEICYCNKDECNGSSNIKLNFTAGLLAIIMLTPVFVVKCLNL